MSQNKKTFRRKQDYDQKQQKMNTAKTDTRKANTAKTRRTAETAIM